MEITKIDNDKFQIKTETIEEVSLSQLEQELAELKEFNIQIENKMAWRETLEDWQKDMVVMTPLFDLTYLENKIKTLKDL